MPQIIIYILVFSIFTLSGMFYLPKMISKAQNIKILENIITMSKVAEVYMTQTPTLNYRKFNGCEFNDDIGYFKFHSKETMSPDKWVELPSTITDCYFSLDAGDFGVDNIRIVFQVSGDGSALGIKPIYRDYYDKFGNPTPDGISDLEQVDIDVNLKILFENYLKGNASDAL